MHLSTIFFILSGISLIVYFVAMIIFHLYSHKNHSIYDTLEKYQSGKNKKYFLLANRSNLFKSFFFALGFYFWEFSFSFKTEAVLLLVFAILGYLIIMIPSKKKSKFMTFRSFLRHFLPVFQFGILSFLVFEVIMTFDWISSITMHVLELLDWMIRIGILGVVMSIFFRKLQKYTGLFERAYLYATNLYYLIVCILILFLQF